MAISLQSSLAGLVNTKLAKPLLRLPYPYYTGYNVVSDSSSVKVDQETHSLYQISKVDEEAAAQHVSLPASLHNESLSLTDFVRDDGEKIPPESNNTPWARARRSPGLILKWSAGVPTLGQAWLVAYILFTIRPEAESIRVRLVGPQHETLEKQLQKSLLAIPHPPVDYMKDASEQGKYTGHNELLYLRAAFWQGAASPVGPKPIWLPSHGEQQLPIIPQIPTLTSRLPRDDIPHENRRIVHANHPIRPQKPAPGSVIYSRWIAHLGEEWSMVVLDVNNKEHFDLFHKWQNDPFVSAGWNETGDETHHRNYLTGIQNDPHQMAVLARFDNTFFAYYEFYWALEDHFGPHYQFHAYDRGRHSLVGNTSFRGAHRVNAWWSSQVHYMFLDEPRTQNIVGEPKAANATVVSYDFVNGFGIEKLVDLPHKRSAVMHLPRDRFFQLGVLGESPETKLIGGTNIGLVSKL